MPRGIVTAACFTDTVGGVFCVGAVVPQLFPAAGDHVVADLSQGGGVEVWMAVCLQVACIADPLYASTVESLPGSKAVRANRFLLPHAPRVLLKWLTGPLMPDLVSDVVDIERIAYGVLFPVVPRPLNDASQTPANALPPAPVLRT